MSWTTSRRWRRSFRRTRYPTRSDIEEENFFHGRLYQNDEGEFTNDPNTDRYGREQYNEGEWHNRIPFNRRSRVISRHNRRRQLRNYVQRVPGWDDDLINAADNNLNNLQYAELLRGVPGPPGEVLENEIRGMLWEQNVLEQIARFIHTGGVQTRPGMPNAVYNAKRE